MKNTPHLAQWASESLSSATQVLRSFQGKAQRQFTAMLFIFLVSIHSAQQGTSVWAHTPHSPPGPSHVRGRVGSRWQPLAQIRSTSLAKTALMLSIIIEMG